MVKNKKPEETKLLFFGEMVIFYPKILQHFSLSNRAEDVLSFYISTDKTEFSVLICEQFVKK